MKICVKLLSEILVKPMKIRPMSWDSNKPITLKMEQNMVKFNFVFQHPPYQICFENEGNKDRTFFNNPKVSDGEKNYLKINRCQ